MPTTAKGRDNNMKVTLDWTEKKDENWIVASLTRESGDKLTEVSINRTSKKGEAFPNFDSLQAGQTIEGQLWQSQAGKWYLFPPSVAKQGQGGAYKAQVIEKAMDKKNEAIGRFQDSKEYSIKVSSTFRAAVDSAIAEWQDSRRASISATGASIEKLFEKWRGFYWMNFDVEEGKDYPPFK